MRKILTLTLLMSLLFTSCSSDDDTTKIVATIPATINPPVWIQGTWDLTTQTTIKGYTVSKSDFCQTLLDDNTSCYKELILSHNNAHLINEVTESSDTTNYMVSIKLNNEEVKYQFRKGLVDRNGNYDIYWVIPNKNPEIEEVVHELRNRFPRPILPPATIR